MVEPPDAPEGYQGPFDYETNNTVVSILSIALAIVTLQLFFPGAVMEAVSAMPIDYGDFWQYLSQRVGLIGASIGVVCVMTIFHESIHYVVGTWYGHDPSFGFRIHWSFYVIPEANPYVVTLDQFIEKHEDIVILASPLIVIDLLAMIGILLSVPPIVDYLSRVVIVTNTTFSVLDIYNSLKVASTRPGTLFRNYDDDGEVGTSYYPPDT